MRKSRIRENHYCSQCRATTKHLVSGEIWTCATCSHPLFPKTLIQPPKLCMQQPNSSGAA